MQQVVVLTGVEVKKTGNSKRGPWALRLFTTSGGSKYQTFDVDLGESLEGHLNLPVELTYEIEDNGDFKNNVIKGWKPSSETAVEQTSESAQSTRDQKQRSKEEVRRTAAVQAAATLIASPNYAGTVDVESVGQLAAQLEELIVA